MRVRYTLRAFAEREAIFRRLQTESPQGARAVKRAIARSIRLLSTFPEMARLTEIPGVHRLTVPRFPYSVFYRIAGREVWIIHIRDARRAPLRGASLDDGG